MKLPHVITWLLACVSFSSSLLHAEDFYVRAGHTSGSRTGLDWNNAWNGFSDIKWGDGAGRLGAGDTLWIAGGNYTTVLQPGASGTSGNPIRIKRVRATDAVPTAAAGWNSAFDSQVLLTGGASIYFYNGVGSYVEIDGRVKSGIRINYPNGGSAVETDGGRDFTDITVRYIEAAGPGPIVQTSDTRGFDMTIAGTLTNLTISHCEAHHSDTLIQVTRSVNLIIEHTDLHHAGAVNAATYHPNTIYLGQAINATIRYNILREIDVEGLFFGDDGNDGVQIYGNLFYQGSSAKNSGRGIEFDNTGNSRNVVIYNNTFVDLPLPGVSFNNGQSHPGAVVRNNIFWNCNASFGPAAHDYNYFSGSSNYGEPNGVANGSSPFVNAAAYDYHITGTLASNKPKDKGVNLGAPFNLDRDGNIRGADGFWDIGAYEFNAGGTTPPPPTNTAPTIGTIANQSTTSGTAVGPISFTIGDAETAAGALTLSGSSNNTTLLPASGISFGGSGGNRTVTLSPVAGQTGTVNVTITVSDGALTATRSFALSVTATTPPPPTNTAPTIGTIANQSTTSGTAAGPISFTIGDAESAAGSLTLTRSSSNTTLLPMSGIVLGGSGSNRTVTLTPAAGQTGTATVTITVSDGSLTAARSFLLTVVAGTTPPPPPSGNGLVAAYSFDEAAGSTVNDASSNANHGQIQGAAWAASGRFGGALNFNGSNSVVTVPNSSSLALGSAMTLQAWVQPAASLSGWRTIVQKEDEAYFLHASHTSAMRPAAGGTINGGDAFVAAPAAIAANSWTHLAVTYDGATVRLYVNGEQVSSQPQTGAIQANSNALRIGGNAPYGQYFQGLIDEVRVYNRALSAAEIQSDMTTPVGTVVVEPEPEPEPANTAPTISAIANQTIITGNVAGPIACTVGDAESAASSLTLAGSSNNTALVPNSAIAFGGSGSNRTVTVTPIAGATGSATITISVSDGALSATRSFTVTVNPVPNTAPTISSVAGISLVRDTASGPLAFNVGDAETAAGSLSVTASSSNSTLLPASSLVLGGSGSNRTISVTPAAGQTGSATVTLRVSDGSLNASSSFTVTVTSPANTAPSISPIANVSLAPSSSTGAIAFTVGDAETAAGSLTVSATSSNAALVPVSAIVFGGSGSNRTVTITPLAGEVGTSVITVAVSDGSLSAARQFSVSVIANSAPTLSSVSDHVTEIDLPVGPLAVTITDGDTSEANLTLAVASDNSDLLPASALALGGSGSKRTLTITPAAGRTGLANITLTASDGTSTDTKRFLLVVNAPASRGLVAAYSFDDGAGTAAKDSSGLGNHGELRGATWTSAGKFGGALNFNGTSAHVFVNAAASLNLGNRMTLEAWVLPSASQSGWRTIVQKQVDAYFLHASSNAALRPAAGGTFGGKVAWATASKAIPIGGWTHLAATFDGTTARLYVNGVLAASKTQAGAIQSNNNPLRIGGNVPYGEFFRGTIDEVRVYNRALSVAEIQSDMSTPISVLGDGNAWSEADVGAVGLSGSTTADPQAGTLTSSGSGAGIGGTSDAFRFVYRSLRGDGTVEARVASLTNTHSAAKAGVMLRGALSADAAKVFTFVNPAGDAAVQVRATAGASAVATSAASHRWVRLVRVGGTVVAMTSADGVSWTAAGIHQVPFGADVYAGFAVTAGDNTQLADGVFAEPFIE